MPKAALLKKVEAITRELPDRLEKRAKNLKARHDAATSADAAALQKEYNVLLQHFSNLGAAVQRQAARRAFRAVHGTTVVNDEHLVYPRSQLAKASDVARGGKYPGRRAPA